MISASLPRNSNFAIAQAAATPNTTFSGTAIAAVEERQLQRGERHRLAQRCDVGLPALLERLREHGGERQHQEERDEAERRERQQQLHRRGLARGAGGHGDCADPSRALQDWSRLIVSSSTKEVTSVTVASAVAPA